MTIKSGDLVCYYDKISDTKVIGLVLKRKHHSTINDQVKCLWAWGKGWVWSRRLKVLNRIEDEIR